MGAGASTELPATVEDALAAGYTQEQIDEHLKAKEATQTPSPPDAAVDDASKPSNDPSEGVHAAFVFIKPHAAAHEAVSKLVEDKLAAAGVTVEGQGVLGAEEIDQKLLIDVHYGAIAKRAVLQEPKELNVPPAALEKFEAAFGLTWASALEQGLVVNAKGASEKLGVDAMGLELAWRATPKLVKFGGGFYCCSLTDSQGSVFYCINGFYLNMREAFTKPPAQIKWFNVRFPTSLSWADFRGKVLGATNPETAVEGSIRKAIYDGWEGLGLESQPNTGNNGVHASASPLEGLFERMNWLQADPASDVFGSLLVAAGVPPQTIAEWSGDPPVSFADASGEGTSMQSLFDLHEDLDCKACIARSVEVLAANPAP